MNRTKPISCQCFVMRGREGGRGDTKEKNKTGTNQQTNQPKQTKKHHKHTSLPQSHSQRGHCQEGGEWKCTQIRQDTLKHKHTPAQARQVQRKGKKKKRCVGEGANLKGTRNNNNNNNNNNLNSNNNLNNNLNDNNLNNNNLNNN